MHPLGKVEVSGAQTILGGIMGIRHAHVKLLPLHPVATATVANIVNHFLFFILYTTQLPESIIWLVQHNWVWYNMSPALVAKCEREDNMHAVDDGFVQ